MTQEEVFKTLVAHAKEYGFIFQSSEIYDGLSAVYDYGQMGVEMKNNIKKYWWEAMVHLNDNIVGIDSAIFMHPRIWEASGHVGAFNDPLIDNKDSKKRYRADVLIEEYLAKLEEKMDKEVEKGRRKWGEAFNEEQFRATNPNVQRSKVKYDEVHARMTKALNDNDLKELRQIIVDCEIACPISGTKNWTDVRQFNLMFSTQLGNVDGGVGTIYLRPETAQGIFVNFLNVQKTGRMKIPFGIAQIGKAFRNEIVARQFIFRMREFEQMEMQFRRAWPGTRRLAWATRNTASTTTRNWRTTPTPPLTSNSSSRLDSRNWKASTAAQTSTCRSTRSSADARSSISIPRPTRATRRTSSRPPSASTAPSWPSCPRPTRKKSWKMVKSAWCCACRPASLR